MDIHPLAIPAESVEALTLALAQCSVQELRQAGELFQEKEAIEEEARVKARKEAQERATMKKAERNEEGRTQ